MEWDNTSENRDINLEKPGYLPLNRFQIYTVSLEASMWYEEEWMDCEAKSNSPFQLFCLWSCVDLYFWHSKGGELFLSDATSIKVPPQIPMTAKVLCDCVLTAAAFYMFSQILRIPKNAKSKKHNVNNWRLYLLPLVTIFWFSDIFMGNDKQIIIWYVFSWRI